MNYITTASGIKFDVANPRQDMIELVDIAHSLANLCHWGGHSRSFFSIAQHCVLVSELCPPEFARWGLLHDAAEAYYGDVSRPLKKLLPNYKAMETACMAVIAKKFDLSWPEPPELKETDNRVLYMEAQSLMYPEALHEGEGHPITFADAEPLPLPLPPMIAKQDFLKRFHELY